MTPPVLGLYDSFNVFLSSISFCEKRISTLKSAIIFHGLLYLCSSSFLSLCFKFFMS